MPRKGHTQKRDVLADPLYNNKVVTKLINNIMLDGKKGVAQKIVYGAFERVEAKTEKPALEVFEEAMNNIMPLLEVKARRVGGATYQVPIEVRAEREKRTCTGWQKQTRRLLTIVSNYLRRKIPWLEENIHWREPEISESWLISMLVRPH